MKSFLLFLMALILVFTGGCRGNAPQPSPMIPISTETPGILATFAPIKTETPISLPTATDLPPTSTATLQPTQQMINPLPPGEYILFIKKYQKATKDTPQYFIEAYTPEGVYHEKLINMDAQTGWVIVDIKKVFNDLGMANDETKTILFSSSEFPYDLEFRDSRRKAYPLIFDSCEKYFAWAPDGKQFIASCEFSKENGENSLGDLFLFKDLNADPIRITNSAKNISYRFPTWSPDGKWILYDRSYVATGVSPYDDGTYSFSTGCFPDYRACDEQAKRLSPLTLSSVVWSPDSQYIAASKMDKLLLFRFNHGFVQKIREIEGFRDESWFAWSPDSKRIAYIDINGIELVSMENPKEGHLLTVLKNAYLLGWKKVPADQ